MAPQCAQDWALGYPACLGSTLLGTKSATLLYGRSTNLFPAKSTLLAASSRSTVTLAGNMPPDFDKSQIPGLFYPSVRKRDARRPPVGPRDDDKCFFKTHGLFARPRDVA